MLQPLKRKGSEPSPLAEAPLGYSMHELTTHAPTGQTTDHKKYNLQPSSIRLKVNKKVMAYPRN